MADSEIYARCLLVKRHGYPLWVPEPYGQSTIYGTKGVRIGDVGHVTREGGFQTLFNIRAAPDDPVNWQGVPDGFQQIHLAPCAISRIPNFYPPDSFVTSTSATQRSFAVGASALPTQTVVSAGATLRYVWSSTEGGILHLPKGASRIDARLKRTFQEQAMRHAKNWYKFAHECSDISNGALYLITGCDKTNSWMVGAFSDCASGSQVVLQLSAIAGALEGQVSYSYSWATSSPASHRVGPSNEETVASDEDPDDLSRDNQVFATDAPQGNNQCTFIRGFKITLRPDLLRRILRRPTFTPQITSIEDATEKDVRLNSTANPGTVSASCGIAKAKASSEGSGDDVGVEDILGSFECCHPSTLINNFMLEKYAEAEVAITHDDDWIHLIDEGDRLWPTDDELLLRLQRRHTFVLLDNVVLPADDDALDRHAPFGGLHILVKLMSYLRNLLGTSPLLPSNLPTVQREPTPSLANLLFLPRLISQVRERFAHLIAPMFSRPVIRKHWDSDGVSGSDGENRGRLSRLKKFVLWFLGEDTGDETGESDDTASPTLWESSVDRSDMKQSENDWRSVDDVSISDVGSALPGGGGEDAEMRMMGRRFENGGMYVNGVGGSMSAGYDDRTFATHQAQDPKVGWRDEHEHKHDCWNGGSLGGRSDRGRYPYGRGQEWQTMNRRTSTAFGYPSPVLDPVQLIKNNQATYPPGSFLNQSFPGRSALYDYVPLSEPPHKPGIHQTALYGHMDMRMQSRAAMEDPRVTGAMLRGTERR